MADPIGMGVIRSGARPARSRARRAGWAPRPPAASPAASRRGCRWRAARLSAGAAPGVRRVAAWVRRAAARVRRAAAWMAWGCSLDGAAHLEHGLDLVDLAAAVDAGQAQRRAVHLRDRGRADWVGLELCDELPPLGTELCAQRGVHHVYRVGGHGILQLAQLGCVRVGQRRDHRCPLRELDPEATELRDLGCVMGQGHGQGEAQGQAQAQAHGQAQAWGQASGLAELRDRIEDVARVDTVRELPQRRPRGRAAAGGLQVRREHAEAQHEAHLRHRRVPAQPRARREVERARRDQRELQPRPAIPRGGGEHAHGERGGEQAERARTPRDALQLGLYVVLEQPLGRRGKWRVRRPHGGRAGRRRRARRRAIDGAAGAWAADALREAERRPWSAAAAEDFAAGATVVPPPR
eukprot:scaffold81902_cov67-Phaeocystis_antarctica.AAC.2